jgi:hypothetical protein
MPSQLPHDPLTFRRFEIGDDTALAAIAGMIIAGAEI